MEIELSEDLQHYKESLVLGLTAKQFFVFGIGIGRRNWDCPAFV